MDNYDDALIALRNEIARLESVAKHEQECGNSEVGLIREQQKKLEKIISRLKALEYNAIAYEMV